MNIGMVENLNQSTESAESYLLLTEKFNNKDLDSWVCYKNKIKVLRMLEVYHCNWLRNY